MRTSITAAVIALSLASRGFCAPDTNAVSKGKVIALVSACGLSSEVVTRIEGLAEKSLKVPFEVIMAEPIVSTNLLAVVPDAKKKQWKEDFAAMVILVSAPTSFSMHASFNTNEMASVVNVTAMTAEDPSVFQSRILKQVVRGTVFAFGMKPSRDPLCASRDYRSVEDLDRMPAVLFPPWQSAFTELAGGRGVSVEKPKFPRRPMPAPPAPPSP